MVQSQIIKIYAQLKPDKVARLLLQHAQGKMELTKNSAFIDEDELHLTILHFGRIDDVYKEVNNSSSIARKRFDELVAELITGFKEALNKESHQLLPSKYDFYGPSHKTLVLEFIPSPDLENAHARAYSELYRFLTTCGINDVASFLEKSHSLQYAQSLRPHIALAKNYIGSIPVLDSTILTFKPMPVTYTM